MNVLLIQLKRIGDLILTAPAIAAVRQYFPRAQISLMVAHGSGGLLPAIPGVDRTMVARGRASDLSQWLAVGRARFDYCLDFSRTDRSAFLTLLSGARHRITWDTVRREPIRQLSYNQFIPSHVRTLHTIDHHLALLAPLGVREASPEIRLALPATARQAAAEIVARHQLGEDFIILHPGSARAEKFWVARRWATIADAFPGRSVLTGGISAMEEKHVAQIKSHARGRLLDLSGQLDLLALAALIERARLLVTIDSAPMHLAGALDTPQVVLFGPTNPFHWRPRTSPTVILQGGSGRPVTDFVPEQPAAALKEISTEAVINAMQSLLSKPAVSVP